MTELKRILLVEDSPNDVELTLAAFEENRIANEVIVARDGEEALDYLYRRGIYRLRAEGNPAVVLLDMKLPIVDGLEVLAQLKADAELRTVPVVVLTSSAEESDVVKSHELGANSYLVKPVEFGAFMDVVAQTGLYWAVLNRLPTAAASVPPG